MGNFPRGTVNLPLSYGANVDIRDRWEKTSLTLATGSNNIKAAKIPVEHNADVNLQDGHGYTALMVAATSTLTLNS